VSPAVILSWKRDTTQLRVGFGSARRAASRYLAGLHLKIQNAITPVRRMHQLSGGGRCKSYHPVTIHTCLPAPRVTVHHHHS
jgi:hypothetical protein